MAAKIWFNYGGVRLVAGGVTATFTYAWGFIEYKPVYSFRRENADFDIKSRLKGYRPVITLKKLTNVADTDYIQFQNLASILSYLVNDSTQRTVVITPRFNTGGSETNLDFTCIIDSGIKPIDTAKMKQAQQMDLQFSGIALVDSIPNIISDPLGEIYWDGTDQYDDGTDVYISDN